MVELGFELSFSYFKSSATTYFCDAVTVCLMYVLANLYSLNYGGVFLVAGFYLKYLLSISKNCVCVFSLSVVSDSLRTHGV